MGHDFDLIGRLMQLSYFCRRELLCLLVGSFVRSFDFHEIWHLYRLLLSHFVTIRLELIEKGCRSLSS